MILTGRTIPQLPQLSATTNTSLLPIQLLGTTYYTSISDMIKSTPFGTFYQDLLPSTSNTISIGSTNYKLKSIFTSSITANQVIATAITTSSITANDILTTKISATTYQNLPTYDYEIHVSQVDGSDITGNGELLNPVATITKALTLTTGSRKTIIIHPGGYSESPTVTSGNTTIATSELTGANTVLYGTLTIGTLGSGSRISGLKMSNLVISGTAQAYISNCTVDNQVIKSSSGYVEIINSELQCTSGIQIVGSGITIFNGNKNAGISVSNASAQVIIKGCNSVVTPSASAGNLAIVDSIVTALGGYGITITNSATTLTLANSQVLVQAGNNVAPISVAGIYSIINTIYDKLNSTFAGGTSTNSIDYFQYINADKFITQGGTSLQYVMGDGSLLSTTAITTTLINTNTVPTKGGTFAMLGDITGNTVGSGASIFVSASSANLTFRSLSSQTPTNLSLTTSGNLLLLSSKTFFDSATNVGSGQQVLATNTIPSMTFRTLSSSTPTNLSIVASGNEIVFSSKTFITGATNSNNGGIGIFKSADTQTLTFRTLSSTSESLLVVANGNGLITFTPRQKFSGAFSSMITQNASSANTIYIMSAETTEHSNRITVVDKTKFTIQSSGTYNIQFSTQLEKTGNGSCTVDIWFRKNGNDIARSNSQIFMAKNSNDKLIASWNYVDVFTGNTDYFQIAWAATSNDVRMAVVTGLTSPTRPDVPSLIVTMFEV